MAASSKKRVYLFHEGNKDMKDLLGGKGANLAEMTNLGLPVPPGFTITTETCNEYLKLGKMPAGLMEDAKAALKQVEKDTGKSFGDPKNPLLVSVRSGAKFSMPGMMDTVLNLGLNDETLKGFIALTGNERFAYDAYRRFIMMFSAVALAHRAASDFDAILDKLKEKQGAKQDTELTADDLKELVGQFKALLQEGEASTTSRRTRWSSSRRPSRPSSSPGTTSAPSSTATTTRSRTTSAPPSTSRRWSSGTWAMTPAPASPSPATWPPARRRSTASS